MELVIKDFYSLTKEELFEIYKLRVSVFVVEQMCPYQEVDDFDKYAVHVYFKEDGKIKAYLRVLPKDTVFPEVSIGRVISAERRKGIGSKLLSEGISVARKKFNADTIMIEAQVYAREFYEKQGFKKISDEFLEDGIPHIKMELNLK